MIMICYFFSLLINISRVSYLKLCAKDTKKNQIIIFALKRLIAVLNDTYGKQNHQL